MKATFWLSVVNGSGRQFLDAAPSTLWRTTRDTAWLPTPFQDRVILWPGEDGDPGDGPLWDVKSRYMDAIGAWHVELAKMVLNPDSVAWQRELTYMGERGRYDKMWWDGDPTEKLITGGWFG